MIFRCTIALLVAGLLSGCTSAPPLPRNGVVGAWERKFTDGSTERYTFFPDGRYARVLLMMASNTLSTCTQGSYLVVHPSFMEMKEDQTGYAIPTRFVRAGDCLTIYDQWLAGSNLVPTVLHRDRQSDVGEGNADPLPPRYSVEIGPLQESAALAQALRAAGIYVRTYPTATARATPEEHCAVWLGKNVPLSIAQPVITEAFKMCRFLRYVSLADDAFEIPIPLSELVDDQIFIGGDRQTAADRGLSPISEEEIMQILGGAKNLADLHEAIRNKNRRAKPDQELKATGDPALQIPRSIGNKP